MTSPPGFAIRSGDGFKIYQADRTDIKELYSDPRPCRSIKYSFDGSVMAILLGDCVELRDGETTDVLHILSIENVTMADFSPLGTFLVTSSRGSVNVWLVSSGELVFETKSRSWPLYQWTDDEMIAMRVVSNEVQFFDGNLRDQHVQSRIKIPNVAGASLSHGSAPYKVSCFVPEKKGAPACVKLYHYGDEEARITKSFFRVQAAQMLWNKLGTAVLIWTHADVDVSGKSYYGETRLYFMRGDGSSECTVPLDKDGQIHDVQWSPTGREFAVVFGFTPAKTVLFNQFCEPVFDFGVQARNTAIWAPHGRFLCVCGLGAMAGEMEFWDRNKLKVIGRAKIEIATTAMWCADSRMFVTAVLSPRMRVDNGITISTYYGKVLHELKFKELLGVVWRPCLDYPDRPASPEVLKNPAIAAPIEKPKVAAYRPPGARRDPNWKPSAVFDRETDKGPRKITASAPKASGAAVGVDGRVVVGADIVTTKSASAKRREKRKAKQKLEEEKKLATPVLVVSESEMMTKKARNLSKKIRQIVALKDGDKELTDEQVIKVGTLGALEAELIEIQEKIAQM